MRGRNWVIPIANWSKQTYFTAASSFCPFSSSFMSSQIALPTAYLKRLILHKTYLFLWLSFKTEKHCRILKFQDTKSYLFIIIDFNGNGIIYDLWEGTFLKQFVRSNINSWDTSESCQCPASSCHISMAMHASSSQQGAAWKASVAVLDKPLVLNDAFCLNVHISTQETNQLTAVGMAMKLLSVVWRRLLRVPWTARRSNQSVLKEISPRCSLDGLILKLKLQYFGHLMWRVDSLEKTLMLGGIGGQAEKGTTEDEMAGWHHRLVGHGFE